MVKNIIIAVLVVFNIVGLNKISNYKTDAYDTYIKNKSIRIALHDYETIIQKDTCRFVNPNTHLQTPKNEFIEVDNTSLPKLILRYSELNCNSCVDSAIYYASQFAMQYGHDKVQVWADYSRTRDYMLFLRMNKSKIDIYKTENQISNIDELNQPYMFILNTDLTMSHIFIPHKEMPQWTQWYLDVVEKYLRS